jgi:hypothetical protein
MGVEAYALLRSFDEKTEDDIKRSRYVTESGRSVSFIARSVQRGTFMSLLVECGL